ncbi:MAG TPA: hypothetical protein VNO43_10490 [Candidatus Eisenbacteria bacterium]|nr:hypothetical protein [Candidatus Eisenbacteria bacterium]
MEQKKRVIAVGATGPDFGEPRRQSPDPPPPEALTKPKMDDTDAGWMMVYQTDEGAVVKVSQRDHMLARIDAAKREILAADSMVKLMAFRSKADAMRQLVRASRDLQLINLANELKLRCETQLGEMLRDTQLSKGGRPSKTAPDSRSGFTLRELGIDKNLSSWCQRLAAAPKDRFERVMAEARTGEWELTRQAVKKLLFEQQPKASNHPGEAPEPQYRCPSCGFSWSGKPK